MSNTSTERAVGQLEGAVKALQDDMTSVRATLRGQDEKLDKLLALHYQRKGATRITKALVGIASSGGLLGWIWEHYHK